MPILDHKYVRVPMDEAKYGKGYTLNSLAKADFEEFSPGALGLGDISTEGRYVQALAAIYDLEGFTAFCNQIESHLVIPEFLTRYLRWMFDTIKQKWKEGDSNGRVRIWGSLPFFVKFMGDGLLLLWDTDKSGNKNGRQNIVLNAHQLTTEYVTKFLPSLRKHVTNPPTRLRCGIARGQVVSVGENGDYVGPCINVASRLQKLGGLTFALSRRGFDLSDPPKEHPFWKRLVLKQVELRGIGPQELVYVKRDELDALRPSDRELFVDVDDGS